jgi:hypothetical protein
MAVGVRSSSSMWSSLRSISSRRRRISERLLAEVMTLIEERGPAGGGLARPGRLVGRADQTRHLHSAAVGEAAKFFASPTSPSGRYRLVALTTSADLFVHARDLFAGANPLKSVSCRHNCPHGSNEQIFGAKEQLPHEGQRDQEAEKAIRAARHKFIAGKQVLQLRGLTVNRERPLLRRRFQP